MGCTAAGAEHGPSRCLMPRGRSYGVHGGCLAPHGICSRVVKVAASRVMRPPVRTRLGLPHRVALATMHAEVHPVVGRVQKRTLQSVLAPLPPSAPLTHTLLKRCARRWQAGDGAPCRMGRRGRRGSRTGPHGCLPRSNPNHTQPCGVLVVLAAAPIVVRPYCCRSHDGSGCGGV